MILLPQPLGPAFLEDKAKHVWLNTPDMGSSKAALRCVVAKNVRLSLAILSD